MNWWHSIGDDSENKLKEDQDEKAKKKKRQTKWWNFCGLIQVIYANAIVLLYTHHSAYWAWFDEFVIWFIKKNDSFFVRFKPFK